MGERESGNKKREKIERTPRADKQQNEREAAAKQREVKKGRRREREREERRKARAALILTRKRPLRGSTLF